MTQLEDETEHGRSMQRDEQRQTEEEDSYRDNEVAVGQNCPDIVGSRHSLFRNAPVLGSRAI
jgi:hypothetical protein